LNKAPDAFRTISEVADDLDLPQHVLRFWESRFPQIRPMKRGGGRRYYRPEDIDLLRGIRHLLYGEGYTIRGVQRILREQGLRTVQSVGQGRAVALPAPSREDAAEGAPETEAGQGILKFLPRRLPDAAADRAPGVDVALGVDVAPGVDAEAAPDPGGAGRHRFAAVAPARDAAEAYPEPRPPAPADTAPETAAPVFAGLAPDDLDRLKTALQRLEECRRLLDGAARDG
jgi:DNA-binding transcriptional MerR regulator